MDNLPYNAVIPTLFLVVPEAKDAYDAWEMPGDPLPYIVFGFLEESLFTPTVDAGGDTDLSRRIFDFLEGRALSDDAEVVNLLWVGLFEAWAARPSTRVKAVGRMGSATKELASQAFQKLTGRDLRVNLMNATLRERHRPTTLRTVTLNASLIPCLP